MDMFKKFWEKPAPEPAKKNEPATSPADKPDPKLSEAAKLLGARGGAKARGKVKEEAGRLGGILSGKTRRDKARAKKQPAEALKEAGQATAASGAIAPAKATAALLAALFFIQGCIQVTVTRKDKAGDTNSPAPAKEAK